MFYFHSQFNLGDKFEIHYYFNDESHTMDALIRHKSEGELLNIIKEVGNILDIKIEVETEAIKEGGLKDWFILSVKRNKTTIIASSLSLILAPILVEVTTNKLTNNDKLLESEIQVNNSEVELNKSTIELNKIQVEKFKQEIKNDSLRNEKEVFDLLLKAKEVAQIISNNQKIVYHRSNFYKNLNNYHKITKISTQIISQNNESKMEPVEVVKAEFPKFIVDPITIQPLIIENAKIEIISPVLKKGSYHWKGLFNGTSIDFLMEDASFKEDIINQKETFINGTYIECVLKINRKLDETGEEKFTGYTVTTVFLKNDGTATVETPQGKLYKAKKEAENNQLNLFD